MPRRPLPIIGDVPNESPGLGFPAYAQALAAAIRGGHPPQFTIGLYGAWGSGKSSLLGAIRRELEETPEEVLVVEFDAWRYERTDHIVVPLLHRISKTVEERGDAPVKEAISRAVSAMLFSLRFKLGPVEFDPGRARDEAEAANPIPVLDDAFSKPFESFRAVSEALGSKRIAILIDDLDRCSPENVVTVLESINLVMDVPGLVFLLALDHDVLTKAISQRYPHVAGEVFIQKLIQLPFYVPQLDLSRPAFLQELIPEVTRLSGELPPDYQELVRDVALLALAGNPRQIKRLLNGFLLLQRILAAKEIELGPDLSIPILGLQLGWPVQYREVHDAVVFGSKDPFREVLGEDEDPDLDLAAYFKRFFPEGRWSLPVLRQAVQLTDFVGTTEKTKSEGRLGSTAVDRLAWLGDELLGIGFAPSNRSQRLYYHPSHPDIRVAFGKKKARLESRNRGETGRPWQLRSSWWSAEAPVALREIARAVGATVAF